MEFKTKKIRSDRIIKNNETAKRIGKGVLEIVKANTALVIVILLASMGIYAAAAKLATAITDGPTFSVKNVILSLVSSPLEQDEQGHTNFLLLGIGGEDHDGGDLTDSIIVASLDTENGLVPMLSIPRDLYLDYDDSYGNRVNRYYEIAKIDYEKTYDEEAAAMMALEDTKNEIGEILDIEIHYYALIDFNGFTEVIDALGGIDIYLEESFYDSEYPIDGTTQFQTFALPAGDNHLDGDQSLKYARSRHSTSDFSRALRQQQIINAIKDKAFSLGVLANPGKLKDVYNAISSNFITNLSFTEIAHMGKIADKFSSDSMSSHVLNDTPWEVAGFLYTPARELYGGASVLLPSAEDYSEIRYFTDLFFYHNSVVTDQVPLQVLNSSGYEGMATDTMIYLERYGFDVVRYGNAARLGLEETTIFDLRVFDTEVYEEDETIKFLKEMLPTAVVSTEIPEDYNPVNWNTEADIIIELGKNFIPYYEENYDSRFYYWVVTPVVYDETSEDTAGTETTTEEESTTPDA